MIIEHRSRAEYDEVDSDFRMKLPALFQRLQRAALAHSEAAGLDPETMMEAGAAWLLNRMRVDIYRLPQYRETITVKTWHKGAAGFRAWRDFELFCDQEKIAAATSQWLYFDLARKRVARIPERVSTPYTDEAVDALEPDAIEFPVDRAFAPEKMVTITTRSGDFDANDHVNNTVYLDYLETVLQHSGLGGGNLRQVGIQYMREIGPRVPAIDAGLDQTGDTLRFRFYDNQRVYAAGFACL